ncbi:toprim domain-containing protein [Thiomicrorhabdus cannonii]|uniref:toprim domain-containing protein n=1 Tax=Thiomicrorhabdus cannonii TaxID=2748011 RepID=UPI0015BF0E26|nr:toprim domain-containing protein [Thiomicrorhabdus cannonii]
MMTHQEHMQANGFDQAPALRGGKWTRFPAPGKSSSNRSAWAIMSGDGVVNYGDWTTGEQYTYFPENSAPMTAAEKRQLDAKIKEERAKAEHEKLKREQTAAKRAQAIYTGKQLRPATISHPYLQSRAIKSHNTLCGSVMDFDNALVLPIYGSTHPFMGVIQSLQFIQPDGSKWFMSGGRKAGGYCMIEARSIDHWVICEGFATGATLAENYTPDASVICAFDAGNLLAVAKFLRNTYPHAHIVIAGDNDHQTEKEKGINAGRDKAIAAAQAVDGVVSIPAFSEDEDGSDWNDRYRLDHNEVAHGRNT